MQHLTVTTPHWSRAPHVTQVAKTDLHIELGAFDIHFESLICRWWAETLLYNWCKYSHSRPPVDQWCRWIFVDPQLHCEHSMELLLTPLLQTVEGYLAAFLRTSRSTPETMILGFFMLTGRPLLSMSAFHALNLEIHSSWVSVISTGSSA